MQIALLTNGLFPWAVGGMQKHSSNLIREWALMGVDLDVYFAQAPSYPPVAEIQEALVPAAAAGRVRFFASASSKLPYFPLHHYADCYVESCRMASKLMQESPKTDFIYAQGFSGWKLLRMKRHGVQLPPVGVNLHGLEGMQQFSSGAKERLLKWVGGPIERWLLRHADVVLSLGGKLDEIIRHVAPSATIVRSGNGIAQGWLCDSGETRDDGPKRFAFVGRYTRRKGLHILYEAVRRLPSDLRFELHLVGEIVESDRLNDARLTYHGPITEERRMQALLRQMDVLVCPSLAEGVPTVVLEGMVSGLAIIAASVGATPDLVDETNGWLISPGDVAVLHQTLLEAMGTSGHRLQELKQHSLDKVVPYLWPNVARTTLAEIRGTVLKTRHAI